MMRFINKMFSIFPKGVLVSIVLPPYGQAEVRLLHESVLLVLGVFIKANIGKDFFFRPVRRNLKGF